MERWYVWGDGHFAETKDEVQSMLHELGQTMRIEQTILRCWLVPGESEARIVKLVGMPTNLAITIAELEV